MKTRADAGVAHDGDADRVLLCDETGSVLDGDEIMAIAALSMIRAGTLKENTLVATVMSNAGLDEAVRAAGGRVVRAGVGDRYVIEADARGRLQPRRRAKRPFHLPRHKTPPATASSPRSRC